PCQAPWRSPSRASQVRPHPQMQAEVGLGIVERMRDVEADDADRRAPASADADPARELGARRIARIARVEEEGCAVVADDPEFELRACDEQITPADSRAVLVLGAQRLIRVAAHAAVAAGVEAL